MSWACPIHRKGKGKSKWHEAKGKGEGYLGVCWRCGEIGHKARECEIKFTAVTNKEKVDEGGKKGTIERVGEDWERW